MQCVWIFKRYFKSTIVNPDNVTAIYIQVLFQFSIQCKTAYKKKSFSLYMEHVSRRNNTQCFEDYVQEWDFAVLRQLTTCRVHYSNLVPINLVPSLCYLDYHTIDLSLYCSSSSVGVAPVWHQFQKSLLSGQTNHCHLLYIKKEEVNML